MGTRAKVFISYSHKDRDLLDCLMAQLKALEQAGIIDVWADTRIDAGEKWYPEIEEAMKAAAVAVCLVSEYFLSSDFCTKEEIPFLLKRAEQDGLLLIPVLLSDCPWYAHRWVQERQMLPGEGQSVRSHFSSNPAAAFSRVAKRVFDKLKDPSYQPPKARPAWRALPSSAVDLTRLPETGAALFGRDEELKFLDASWSSAENDSPTRTRILAFVAHGGVGKSTLVNRWLNEMKRDNFRGATHVFGWSFYSQGAKEEAGASADAFIDAALKFFGDQDPSAGSPWDKGDRLARLAGEKRTLLVLDGLEPLQSGRSFDRGKLQDPALESLLRGLARRSQGLCLITTREPLPDLARFPSAAAHDLEQITPDAGRALLRTIRVVGTDAELEALAKQFGPHALAVSLLGVYLYETDPYHGVSGAQALEKLPGREPIDRVLEGFKQLLAGCAELEVLGLLGLFDRPADLGCLGALRARPPIPGLTDNIAELNESQWGRLLGRLEKLRLVHVLHKGATKPALDCHPLIREYFAKQLSEEEPDAWRAAHRRVYEYLRDSTPDKPHPTLDDLQPLYQAVAHGCKAGLQQEVCDKVCKQRILRGNEYYSSKKLGAFGSELGAVACFFEQPWNRVSSVLTEDSQAWLLNQAAFHLRAVGRPTEAVEPMRAGLEMRVKQENWKQAAIGAGNLSELDLTLGEAARAAADAEQSMVYADRSGDEFQRLSKRATRADALHQAGRQDDAQARFREAEEMQAKNQPEYPLLYSIQGFRYCDLLLAATERATWQMICSGCPLPTDKAIAHIATLQSLVQRPAQTLKWYELSNEQWLLDIACDHLTLGRAALYRAILEKSDVRSARSEIDHAVAGLRSAGQADELPKALLTRAWLRFLEDDTDGARADLDEAWQIAERGPMRLHMADIHLYRARLFRDKDELKKAREMIEQCGYWRRKEELEDAEAAAKGW